MNMNEYLPNIHDEVIYEDDYHKITKIATFNKKCYVHTFGDRWDIRPEWEVKYTLTEYGRKIKSYESEEQEESISHKTRESSDTEITLKKEYEDVCPVGNYYVCRKTINDVIYSSLLDSEGRIIVEGQFFLSSTNSNMLCEERNRISFYIGNRCGVMDFGGNIKIAPKYGNISSIYDELIIMADKEGCHLITDQGDLLWEHKGLLSMSDDLITVWDEKPQILRYECKRKPKEDRTYIHINDWPISEEEKVRASNSLIARMAKLENR